MNNRAALIIALEELKDVLLTGEGKVCALGELITLVNYYSAHHIRPVRDKGLTLPVNIIPLSLLSHDQFNFIERYNPQQASIINGAFIDLKESRNSTIILQLKAYKDELLNRYGYDPTPLLKGEAKRRNNNYVRRMQAPRQAI